MLKWCLETAQEKNLREEDYWGGFVIDEMKIQVCIGKKKEPRNGSKAWKAQASWIC